MTKGEQKMGPSRRVRKRSGAVLAIFIAAMGAAFGFTAPVGADHTTVTEVSGRAFGIDTEGLVQIDKEPLVVLPSAGTDDPITDRTARVDLSPVLTVDALEVETSGETGPDGFSDSEARVADVLLLGDPIDAATDGALGDLLDDLLGDDDGDLLGGGLLGGGLLGGDDPDDPDDGIFDGGLLGDLLDSGLLIEAVESECRADAEGADGSTTVVGLTDQGEPESGEILELDDELEIDLGVLRVVLNEQEETNEDGFRKITVNGARITVLGDGDDIDEADDDAVLDIILAQSQCHVNFEEVEETTTTTEAETTTTTDKDQDDNDKDQDDNDKDQDDNDKDQDDNDKDQDDNDKGPAPVFPGGNNSATNNGSATNNSGGNSTIDTGDANAIGNSSNTEITQTGNAAGGSGGDEGGGANVEQDASVTNEGEADANTGGNLAVGNDSDNQASNNQSSVVVDDDAGADAAVAEVGAAGDDDDDDGSGGDNAAANTGTASNTSDGTADITTGDANAAGNISNTEITQTGNAAGGSGGGSSDDDDDSDDDECWGDADVAAAAAEGDDSDDAEGDVDAAGNTCDKCEDKPDPCDDDCDKPKPCDDDDDDKDKPSLSDRGLGGPASVEQSATVTNEGEADANTGGNTAIGNASRNRATNNQSAVAAD